MKLSSSDSITLSDLSVEAFIGVYPHEQEQRQPVKITVELFTDLAPAGQNDDLTLTVNYESLANGIKEMIGRSRFRLIESMAEAVATYALEQFCPRHVRVTIKKYVIPAAEFVAVSIYR
jgi:dihydroneopterin aldolase